MLLAILGAFLALVTPAPSYAADPPVCSQTLTSACIQGTLIVRLGKQQRKAIDGVTVELTTPSGKTETVQTDADGKWMFNVAEEGDFHVSLDDSTLPSGMAVQGNNNATVHIKFGTISANSASFSINADGYDPHKQDKSAAIMQGVWLGLVFGLLLALASMGVSLIYGTTGMSNFAHGEQVTLGGVLGWLLCNNGVFGLDPMPLLPGGILVVLICAATGWIQDRFVWQPLRRRGLGLIQLMIVSIGLSLALLYFYQLLMSTDTKQITKSPPTAHYILGGRVAWTSQSLVAVLISLAIIAGIGLALMKTRLGRATRAVSDNPALASASGIDTDKVIRLVWTVAMGLAGLSGFLYALVIQNGITALTGSQILLLLFAAVTLGGLGTAFGALVGSLAIGLIAQVVPTLGVPDDLKYATAMLLMILMLLFRPQGLLGKAQRVG
ncbi:hypothetical protein GCM10027076_29290 [Nocardioides montaniterrae]